jgi:hypothetical protein
MKSPADTIRKLLWLADHAATPAEALLARGRADELAVIYNVDVAALCEPPSPPKNSSRRYDWFSGNWVHRDRW